MTVAAVRLPVAVAPAQVRTSTVDAIRFGAAVHCRDGRAGKVARLVLDSNGRALTHVVVSCGLGIRKNRVVPSDRLVMSSEDRVDLNMSTDELHQLSEFQELRKVVRDPTYHPTRGEQARRICLAGGEPILMSPAHSVPAGWVVRHRHSGLPGAAVPLRRETGVYYGLERVGRLEKFLLEDDRRTIAELVVKPSRSRDQLVLVPVDGVEFVDEDGIWLEFDPRSAVEPGVGSRSASAAADVAVWSRETRVFSETDTNERCANCRFDVGETPFLADGSLFCCEGCARGGPCSCVYEPAPYIAALANDGRQFHLSGERPARL